MPLDAVPVHVILVAVGEPLQVAVNAEAADANAKSVASTAPAAKIVAVFFNTIFNCDLIMCG